MTRFVPVLLACIAAALSGVLYLESRAGAPDPAAGVGAHRAPGIAAPARLPPVADHAPEWVATILDRPLFSPTRRPSATAAAGPGKPVAEEAPPRLAGVLVSEAGRGAIFARPGDKPTLAAEGDRVGPYLVRSIAAGEVTVVGPHGVVVLHPAFANARESGPTVPVAATPSLLDKLRAGPRPAVPMPTPDAIRGVLAKRQAEPSP